MRPSRVRPLSAPSSSTTRVRATRASARRLVACSPRTTGVPAVQEVPAVSISIDGLELEPGGMVGPCGVDSLIADGGMGRVYRAHDSSLDREVAIKVLPSQYAADGARLRRFEQEARASGALTHPNLVTVYDVGIDHGRPYLVTELLDGETLRERLDVAPCRRTACEIAADSRAGWRPHMPKASSTVTSSRRT